MTNPFLVSTTDEPLENNSHVDEIIGTESQKVKHNQIGQTLAARNTSQITIDSNIECDQVNNEKTKPKKKKEK